MPDALARGSAARSVGMLTGAVLAWVFGMSAVRLGLVLPYGVSAFSACAVAGALVSDALRHRVSGTVRSAGLRPGGSGTTCPVARPRCSAPNWSYWSCCWPVRRPPGRPTIWGGPEGRSQWSAKGSPQAAARGRARTARCPGARWPPSGGPGAFPPIPRTNPSPGLASARPPSTTPAAAPPTWPPPPSTRPASTRTYSTRCAVCRPRRPRPRRGLTGLCVAPVPASPPGPGRRSSPPAPRTRVELDRSPS